MKKIYFACSIRGGRQNQPAYTDLIKIIKQRAIVLSELFGDESLTDQGHTDLSDKEIWDRDMNWLKEADAMIAEISTPSLGVGYEIAKCESMRKPILALYQQDEQRLSAMISGSQSLVLANYKSLDEAKLAIENFISSLS